MKRSYFPGDDQAVQVKMNNQLVYFGLSANVYGLSPKLPHALRVPPLEASDTAPHSCSHHGQMGY